MIVARHFSAWWPRDGMIGSDRRATIGATNRAEVRITPFPTGRIFSDEFQALKCLATIIQSLRDKNLPNPGGYGVIGSLRDKS